jgi:hypothetical protein
MAVAFIEDNLGKLMALVGVLLLVVAVLWSSALLGSLISAASLFLGIILLFFGLGLQMGLFSGGLRNLGGVGTILISVSVVCFALGIAVFQFAEVTGVQWIPEFFPERRPLRGFGWWMVPVTIQSYAWLTGIMMYTSFAALISGIALKIFQAVK